MTTMEPINDLLNPLRGVCEFSHDKPFTSMFASLIKGFHASVTVNDSGRTHTYEGIVSPKNNTITMIGNDEILNEYIRKVKVNFTKLKQRQS